MFDLLRLNGSLRSFTDVGGFTELKIEAVVWCVTKLQKQETRHYGIYSHRLWLVSQSSVNRKKRSWIDTIGLAFPFSQVVFLALVQLIMNVWIRLAFWGPDMRGYGDWNIFEVS